MCLLVPLGEFPLSAVYVVGGRISLSIHVSENRLQLTVTRIPLISTLVRLSCPTYQDPDPLVFDTLPQFTPFLGLRFHSLRSSQSVVGSHLTSDPRLKVSQRRPSVLKDPNVKSATRRLVHVTGWYLSS